MMIPTAFNLILQEVSSRSAEQTAEIFQQTQLRQSWIIVFTSIFTAVVLMVYTAATIFYTIFARRQSLAIAAQLAAMNEQAAVMRESLASTKTLVQQNQRSVNAAEETAATAKESVAIEQRAYVEVKEMTMRNLAPGMKPTVRITWANGGRTPAWRLKCSPIMIIANTPPEEAEVAFTDSVGDISGGFLPAGEERSIDYELVNAPTNEEIARISKNQAKLYILAKAFYTDARQAKHQANVCAMFDYHQGKFFLQ